MHRNAQTARVIVSLLSSKQNTKITGIKNANQLWKKFETIDEGTDFVTEVRDEQHQSQFNFVHHGSGRRVTRVYDRLLDIVNKRALEATITGRRGI